MRPSWLTVCFLLLIATVASSCADDARPDGPPGTDPPVTVARVTSVIDGDTIRVSLDGRDTTVRIIGIDTPEKDAPYTEEECFGAQASTYAERAMDGATVGLEFDVDRTDRYDRTLAYVWIDGELFEEGILRDGYAVLLTVPPNVKYVERLTAAQAAARARGAGLWGSCPVPP